MTGQHTSDRDALAAEYVMGLLGPGDRDEAERLIASDATFAANVDAWRERFSPMDDTAAPVMPPGDLWPRILESLPGAAATAAPATMAARAASRRVGTVDKPSFIARLWDDLGFWRMAGLAGLAASLVLAVGLAFLVQREARTPVLVAVLVTDSNRPAAIVNAFADGRTELVPLESIPVPEGRVLEIWTLWDRQVGPRSVGLIGQAQSTRLRLDNLPLGPNQLFEITLEPAGGSPIGRPTGPILMKGTTSQAL